MRLWIANPLSVFQENVSGSVSGLVIKNNIIEEVLTTGQEPTGVIDQKFDASDLVITPGLVNTHHHYYQTLTRAFPSALNKELFPWLKSLYPVWAGLDEEMIHSASQLASIELMLSGCTTSADHHYLFPERIPEALDVQVDAVKNLGLRSTLTRGSMSLGEDQGGLPPRSTIQDPDTILSDCERVIKQYHDGNFGSHIQIALAPCSPFSVTRELMIDCANLARRLGVRLHTHLAETHDETEFCLRTTGYRPLDYLEDVEWLHDDVWLAHGIHFEDEEIKRLGRAGVGITHCPSSNMVLGSGICRNLELEAADARVGIGVDGSASNDGSNMIQECRQALLIQRLRYGSAEVTHEAVLRWATSGSAACLGRQDIGKIAPGMLADLAFFRLEELRFSGSGDPLAALLLCGAHQAKHVMVDGRWVVKDGEHLTEDIEKLKHHHGQQAMRLAQRYQ